MRAPSATTASAARIGCPTKLGGVSLDRVSPPAMARGEGEAPPAANDAADDGATPPAANDAATPLPRRRTASGLHRRTASGPHRSDERDGQGGDEQEASSGQQRGRSGCTSSVALPEHAHRLGQFERAHDERAARAGRQHGSSARVERGDAGHVGVLDRRHLLDQQPHRALGRRAGWSYLRDLAGRAPRLAGQDHQPVAQRVHVDADRDSARRDPERHGFAPVLDGLPVGPGAELHTSSPVDERPVVLVGEVVVARDATMSPHVRPPARPGRLLDLREGRLRGGSQCAADPVPSAESAQDECAEDQRDDAGRGKDGGDHVGRC